MVPKLLVIIDPFGDDGNTALEQFKIDRKSLVKPVDQIEDVDLY